jgi:hypothetical protein
VRLAVDTPPAGFPASSAGCISTKHNVNIQF